MYRHKAHETHDAGACCADSSTRRLCRGAVSHAITNHTSSKKHHMEGKRHSVLCAHRTLSLSLMLAGCPSIVMGKSNSIATRSPGHCALPMAARAVVRWVHKLNR